MNISTNLTSISSLNSPSLEQALGFVGLDSWGEFIKQVYGYRTHRLVAYENDLPVGALVLFEINHPLFGHYLTTAPYGSYGGFAYNGIEVRDKLLVEAGLLASDLKTNYVVVRTLKDSFIPPETWIQQPIYCTYKIRLPMDSLEMLGTFSANHRNHIRKSRKKGNVVRFGHLELFDDAYKALTRCMHELGSPYHGQSYLRSMAENLGKNLKFAVLYGQDRVIAGGGVFITQGNMVSNLHANVLKKMRTHYAGELLYMSAIEHFIEEKKEIFDLGRSLIGSGNEAFKLKWTNEKIPLSYWYLLVQGQKLPEVNQNNPKFKMLIEIWKKIPAIVVNTFGDYVIRGLA